MKIFRTEAFKLSENPTPGSPHKPEILSAEIGAKLLGGIFAILPPGTPANIHYHRHRESIIIAISGEAVEIVEGDEIPVRAGDILFIPPGEKHGIANRSDSEFRYFEFFTHPPVRSDFVEVESDVRGEGKSRESVDR